MTVPTVKIEEFLDRGNQITDAVAASARICAQFIPRYELPPNTKSVISTTIARDTLLVDDVTTIPLAEIRVRFTLDWQQLSTSDLATPLYIVHKQAQAYCRLEDRLLLVGQAQTPASNQLPFGAGIQAIQPAGEIERGQVNGGLSRADIKLADGDIYASVARYYSLLESKAVFGPWAIVMGVSLFDRSDRMEPGFVDSPRQRIENLLGTKVYRSNILPNWTAILMGGAASSQDVTRLGEPMGPVDRAVALEPQLRFVRTDENGRFEFAIVGSLTLRVRDKDGIIQIVFNRP